MFFTFYPLSQYTQATKGARKRRLLIASTDKKTQSLLNLKKNKDIGTLRC